MLGPPGRQRRGKSCTPIRQGTAKAGTAEELARKIKEGGDPDHQRCARLPGLLRDLYRSSSTAPPAGTAISLPPARPDHRRESAPLDQPATAAALCMSGSNSCGQRMATMPPSMPKSSRPMRGDGYSPRHAAGAAPGRPSPSARPRTRRSSATACCAAQFTPVSFAQRRRAAANYGQSR